MTPAFSRRHLLASLAVASMAVLPSRAAAPAAPSVRPPNVLLIAVDDLRPELGCYGNAVIKSPNLDQLAAQGMLFRNAYCQQAVSAPTRASLLSGLRPDSTGIFDLNHPLRKQLPEVLTMPQYFREHGYETLSLGKVYHHAADDNGKGWSSPAWRPQGPWKGRGYLASEVRDNDVVDEASTTAAAKATVGIGPAWECADVADDTYPDGQTELKAAAELQRLKAGGKPFFLAVGFLKPHLPFCAPKRYWDLYDEAKITLPGQTTWPEGMPPLAGSNWSELRQYVGIPAQGPVSPETARKLVHGYHACVSYTDALVGKLLSELDRQGLRENTIVVVFGDHGWKLGEYGAWCKHTNFELDTHVPLIISAPGVAGNGRPTGALAEFVDLYPTLAELCGLPVPAHCEGTSLRPVLQDPDRAWKRAAFSQYPRSSNLMGYSVRSGPWRYTEWINRKTRKVMARELYDHQAGPVASRNLADDPACAATVRELSALLDGGRGWRQVQASLAAPAPQASIPGGQP